MPGGGKVTDAPQSNLFTTPVVEGAVGVDPKQVQRDLAGVAPATPEHSRGLDDVPAEMSDRELLAALEALSRRWHMDVSA